MKTLTPETTNVSDQNWESCFKIFGGSKNILMAVESTRQTIGNITPCAIAATDPINRIGSSGLFRYANLAIEALCRISGSISVLLVPSS